jgi:stress response protein YsnF
VVEEVVVGKEVSNRTETVTDTVRGTQVEVERTPGSRNGAADVASTKKTTPE